ncbi:MAG: hypothetical protein WA793_14795 [Sphingorhabdus sp.]
MNRDLAATMALTLFAIPLAAYGLLSAQGDGDDPRQLFWKD